MTTTLETQTVQTLAESYFASLNDRTTNKMHLIQGKNVGLEEIQNDAKVWMAGFTACAKLLDPSRAPTLPPLESVLRIITTQFPDKAKIAA